MSPFSDISRRYYLLPLFLLAAFFACAAPVFWYCLEVRQGDISKDYANRDLYQWVYPAFHYGFAALRDWRLPLWNSRQMCGAPFQADWRVGLFQPLNAVFLFLPTERAMAVHGFLCLFLAGTFFALFVRSLGSWTSRDEPAVSHFAAMVGAVAFAFSGASASVVSQPAAANAMVWAPFAFWSLREYARGVRYRTAVVAGLAVGMLLLSGANALAAAFLILWMVHAVLRVLFSGRDASLGGVGGGPPRTLARRAAGLGVAVLVALAVSAVQLIPSCAWLWTLERPWDVFWSLRVAGQVPSTLKDVLAQLFMAAPSAAPRVGYVGISTLLLIPAALFCRRSRSEAAFFGLAALALVLISTGLGAFLPPSFPAHAFLFPALMCIGAIVSLGADRLLTRYKDHRSPRVRGAALVVFLCAGALFMVSGAQIRGYVIAMVAAIVPFLLFRAGWLAIMSGIVLAVILFVDLTSASVNSYRHPFQDAPMCYRRYEKLLETAEEEALGARVFVSAHALNVDLPANLGMIAPVFVANGVDIPQTMAQAAWWRRLFSEEGDETGAGNVLGTATQERSKPPQNFFDLMAARVFLVGPGGPLDDDEVEELRLRERTSENGVRLLVSESAAPRGYWVPVAQAVQGVEAALDRLADPAFNAARECVVDVSSRGLELLARGVLDEGGGEQAAGEEASAKLWQSCSVEEGIPERVVIRVDARAPGIVVLADSYAPGWIATVDGAPCPILRTNGMFRGVGVLAGEHEIRFEYRPISFVVGYSVSLVALVCLFVGWFVAVVKVERIRVGGNAA